MSNFGSDKYRDTRIKNPRIKWGFRFLLFLVVIAFIAMTFLFIESNRLKDEVVSIKVSLSSTPAKTATTETATPIIPTNTPVDPTNTPVPTSTATETATPIIPTNTPVDPTNTPVPTSMATPTSTTTPSPELKVEAWMGEVLEGKISAQLWYSGIINEEDISFMFIDEEGDTWPYHAGIGWSEDNRGRFSIPAYTDCYMPFGLYTVEAYNGKELLAQTVYNFQHLNGIGAMKIVSLDEAEGFTKSDTGWLIRKKSVKRDDTYLLELTPQGNDVEVRLSNQETLESVEFKVNQYELVRIDLLAYFYNEAGEVVDGAVYGFTIWPKGMAEVETYFGESKIINVVLDKGEMFAYDENIARYWNPYILPDGSNGTFVTMDMVNPVAYKWLLENKACPSEVQYDHLAIHSETPKVEPTTPVEKPANMATAPFDKVSRLETPANYLSVEGTDTLRVSGRAVFPLATCQVGDAKAVAEILASLGEQAVNVWLWSGFAHTFESNGVVVWAACGEWKP